MPDDCLNPMANDAGWPHTVPDLRTENAKLCAEIERLRKIEIAAQAITFGVYPAHGSGFVTIVTGGNINDLAEALYQQQPPVPK